MKTIVITGSTRGIGLGMATELLKRGARVVINGRQGKQVEAVVNELRSRYPRAAVAGFAADTTKYAEVKGLWDHAVTQFGKVDVWINNAGVMNDHALAWELSPGDLEQTVAVNLTGSMYGAKVAIEGMLKTGGGHVYNFEGFGSNGRQFQPYMGPYGATKAAIRYLTKALSRETRGTNVRVGAISPGIVVTDLLRQPYEGRPQEWAKAKKIFNILGDHVETVTPYLAEEVLKGRKSGEVIAWLTPGKALRRFLGALLARRDLFALDPVLNS